MIEKLTDDIKPKLSKMMKHYCAAKEQYENCILFYRLGDFYEMFFDDAVKVSKMLDLTLTGRECGLGERAAMCGIPFHAADAYIAKLVELGERVAICEQLTEPTGGNVLVERDVVRIVSAGTLTDESIAATATFFVCFITSPNSRISDRDRSTHKDSLHTAVPCIYRRQMLRRSRSCICRRSFE